MWCHSTVFFFFVRGVLKCVYVFVLSVVISILNFFSVV